MQNSSVYLYPNKIDIYSLASSWIEEEYRKVYNRNIKIYRSADNRIDLQVRSSDQKTKNVAGTVLVFNLISKEKKLILQKDCSVDDATIGRTYVTLTRDEMLDIEEGFYEYSIVQETRTTISGSSYTVSSRVPMYLDSQFGVIGTIEVSGDVLGSADTSQVIDTFSRVVDFDQATNTSSAAPFTLPRPNYKSKYSDNTYADYYLSEIINGRPDTSTANSLHTFQFYFDNYDGEVVIQGSINPQGATPAAGDWYDLATVATTDRYKNITGKWNWFRIKHTPAETNTGSVDKILYR